MELGAIFSLIGTMGVSLGGSGKLSGLNALNAMGGMLKGWQQGKKDVFAKEQTIFDKEVARIKSANDMLLKDLEQYQKLRVTDKEAAMVKSQEIASKNPGVIASLIESGKSDVAYEIAKKNTDIHTEIIKLAEKNRVSANGGMLPKDAKTKEDYKVKYLASKNIDEIMDLLNDPQVSRLITPATKFTPDFIQNLRERFPELGPKLARVQAIEFETGGKSLTKNEREVLEPIYGWKGIGVDALRTRLTEAQRNLNNNLALNEVTYPGFKPLREQFDKVYSATGKVPDVPVDSKQDTTDLRSKAKARIAAGGDEDAVKKRFKELTGEEL
jgi:beta-glucosidase-like glycosyl hydrolase